MLQDNEVVSQESRNLAVLNWLGCLLTLFVIPLMFYLTKIDDAYVREQAKKAINWSITALLLLAASFICPVLVTFIIIPFAEVIPDFILFILFWFIYIPVFIVIGAFFTFCIKGIISNYKCKNYEIPSKIQLFNYEIPLIKIRLLK